MMRRIPEICLVLLLLHLASPVAARPPAERRIAVVKNPFHGELNSEERSAGPDYVAADLANRLSRTRHPTTTEPAGDTKQLRREVSSGGPEA